MTLLEKKLLGVRQHRYAWRKMLRVAADVAWSVCMCDYQLETIVSLAKNGRIDGAAPSCVDSGQLFLWGKGWCDRGSVTVATSYVLAFVYLHAFHSS